MDDIVKDVNDNFDEADPAGSPNIQFKGSDDFLRQKVRIATPSFRLIFTNDFSSTSIYPARCRPLSTRTSSTKGREVEWSLRMERVSRYARYLRLS